jgi:hypothetical protein
MNIRSPIANLNSDSWSLRVSGEVLVTIELQLRKGNVKEQILTQFDIMCILQIIKEEV